MSEVAEFLDVVEIVTSEDDVPALEELVLGLGYDVSSYCNVETHVGHTYIVAEDGAQAAEIASAVQAMLPDWNDCLTEPVRSVSCIRMAREDWAESWKRFFHAFRASNRLVVKPSWEEYTAQPGDLILELDPGMSFGTGHHGTTKACLKFLDELQAQEGAMSMLDAGTGSGILAIGAHLLGYSPVRAFDYDPQAVLTATENLEKSGWLASTELIEADVTAKVPLEPSRVVVANILAPVLMASAENILSLVDRSQGGYLVLSGILTEQYPEVRDCFVKLGAKELSSRKIDEWTSGLFAVPQK
ncbi:MAG: 50S ribosomal protein L11 methyltransferase [Victivallales bacterium]|nr:50S ribosomal protein L11 methyltransferase [Victivallales bacterium]